MSIAHLSVLMAESRWSFTIVVDRDHEVLFCWAWVPKVARSSDVCVTIATVLQERRKKEADGVVAAQSA